MVLLTAWQGPSAWRLDASTMAYAVTMAMVWVASLRIARVCFRTSMPLIAAALAPAMLLYLGSLVAGAAGVYTPMMVLASIGVVAVVAAAIAGHLNAQRTRTTARFPARGGNNVLVGVVLGFAVALASPVGPLVLDCSRGLISPDRQLAWDTVSYHLPAFVEFFHHGTLWAMEGPFHSYHFGYELIANVPTLLLKGPWGVHMAHVMTLLLAILVIVELAGSVVDRPARPPETLRWLAIAAGTVAIWGYLFAENLRAAGKNDVFMMVCLLASLTVALRATEGFRSAVPPVPLAAVCGGLLGLAVATKPTALAFVLVLVPFFAFVAPIRDRFRAMATCGACAALVGGFWPLRNLVLLGSLSDPNVGILWTRTVIAQRAIGALYQPTIALLPLMLVGVALIVLLVRWAQAGKGTPARLRSGLLLAFLTVGVLAFALAPAGVEVVEGQARWSFRLGMATFVLSAMVVIAFALGLLGRLGPGRASRAWPGVAIGVVAGLLLAPLGLETPLVVITGVAAVTIPALVVVAWYRPRRYWPRRYWPRRSYWRFAIAASFAGMVIFLAVFGHYGSISIDGLPGYERVGRHPRTGIYRWVQSLDTPVRIYAVALRPWGLYGHSLQNRVFYDLHGAPFASANGLNRLKRVLDRFQPDLVITAIDPHSPNDAGTMPRRAWLEAEPCMTLAYQDETVAAFRVEGRCEHLTSAPWLSEAKRPRSSG